MDIQETKDACQDQQVGLKNGRIYYHEEALPETRNFYITKDEAGTVRFINLKTEAEMSTKLDLNVTKKDLQVFLYTHMNPRDGVLIEVPSFTGQIASELFDPTLPIVITTHGWTGAHMSNTNRLTRDGVLANGRKANVLIVAWERPSNLFYTYAAKSVPKVAQYMAEFINNMMSYYHLKGERITLVGQSLGGQLVGLVGALLTSPASSIVAVDPAGLLFYPDQPENGLDATDATQVHVIHTNGGMLGMRSSLGHADYHPNGGGMNQPGCPNDFAGTCAHYRAYWLWGESLLSGGFKATKCTDYNSWKSGNCDGNESSFMGQWPVDMNARGDFFLDTNGEKPFAMG